MHLVGKLAIVVNVSASGCLFLCASLHQAGHLQPSHDSDNDLPKNHRPECLYVNSRIITFSKLTFSWCKITHCYSVLCFPSLRILKMKIDCKSFLYETPARLLDHFCCRGLGKEKKRHLSFSWVISAYIRRILYTRVTSISGWALRKILGAFPSLIWGRYKHAFWSFLGIYLFNLVRDQCDSWHIKQPAVLTDQFSLVTMNYAGTDRILSTK